MRQTTGRRTPAASVVRDVTKSLKDSLLFGLLVWLVGLGDCCANDREKYNVKWCSSLTKRLYFEVTCHGNVTYSMQ